MKKLAMLVALCVGFSLSAVAQYGSSSGSSQGSTSSGSAQTTTTTKKSSKKSKGKMGAAKEHSVTGCLSGPNDEGLYLLKNGHYKKGLEVGGNDELKNHVGHEVRLTGTWATESELGATGGATEAKEGKTEKHERSLKVSSIKHLADTCTAKAGKSKKEKGSSSTTPPGK